MASLFALDSLGAEFSVKVTDCTGGTVPDEATITDQKIVFYKPDGTTFEKDASLITDTENPTEYFIVYQNNSPEASILDDNTAFWEYAGKLKLIDDNEFQTSQRKIFWVTGMVEVPHNKNIQRIIDVIKADPAVFDEGETRGLLREVIFGDPDSDI